MEKRTASILIVEDERDTRDLLARLLTAEGYTVRVCANGWEALLSVENPPDLILLDMMLPGMDGATFLRSLRGQKVGRNVPVVVLTALDVAEATEKVHGLGVRHVLPKHGNLFPLLKDTLRRVLPTPEHPYHVELPEQGSLVRPYLDVYLKMLACFHEPGWSKNLRRNRAATG